MPYEVQPNDGSFDVINSESGDVKATHDSKEAAERQVKLLNEIEKDQAWEDDNATN